MLNIKLNCIYHTKPKLSEKSEKKKKRFRKLIKNDENEIKEKISKNKKKKLNLPTNGEEEESLVMGIAF